MATIIGITIGKGVVTNKYPLDIWISQHLEQPHSLFDKMIIGYASGDSETENKLYHLVNKYSSDRLVTIPLAWGTDPIVAWDHEDQYLELMNKLIGYAQKEATQGTWVFKLDLDEFIHEKDFKTIRYCMDNARPNESVIQLGYKSFLGSLRYTTPDPTPHVGKAFRVGVGSIGQGGMTGDGMQISPAVGYGVIHIGDVQVYHVGHVKDPDRLTRRIREHVVNTRRFYPNADINKLQFVYPKHKVGESAWPLGISGKEYAEYNVCPTESLPMVLKEHVAEFDYYIPEGVE